MKNITVSVDDEVYRQARVAAAKEGTSVSALVAEYLKAFARGDADRMKEAEKLDRKQRQNLVKLFGKSSMVLGYKPTRAKTYER